MRKFKFAAKFIAASIAAVSLSCAVLGAELTDIAGHWSEEYVKYGVENGYITGYPDGTFLPDKPVTRAEFSKMVNSALGITKQIETSFPDVFEDEWYYGEVGKALYAGYVSGYEDGTFRAHNNITRQEAAVILSRIATRSEEALSIDSFSDCKDVADWAKSAFDFAYSKGFFSGDDLGKLNPKATLTRGQAAKLLNSLQAGENIVTGDYTVSLDNAVCSETIFTDNVYFTATGEEPKLLLDGCTVLGTVYIRTQNNSVVTVEDSAVNNVLADTAYTEIVLEDGSKIKEIFLESPAAISGEGVGSVVLEGSGLASETTELLTSADSVLVYSDAVIKAEELNELKVKDTVSLMLQSGSVKNMEILSAAAGSVITLSNGVKIENLTVSGASSFMGTGKIVNANNKVSGVTYATKPEKMTGVSESDDANAFSPISVSPKNGETGVFVTSPIIINFGSAIYDADGKSVTQGYIEQNVELRRSTSDGSKIYFEADLVSSSKFEIDPDGNFAGGTRYYVIIPEGIFSDANGNKNSKLTYNFITKDTDDDDNDYISGTTSSTKSITFTPSNGKENISVDDAIKVTFSSAIRRQSGSEVTNSYLANTAIELRENSSNGDRVSVSASINSSKKIVTITPDSPLKPGTRYYIIVTSGSLEYSSDSTNISKKTSYFTTSDDIGITITPKSGATGVALDSNIEIEFNCEITLEDGSRIYDDDLLDIIQLKKGSTSGTDVDFEASIDSDKKVITVHPLDPFDAGQKYTVIIPAGVVANENETLNKKFTSTFTAIAEMQPMITPVDGEEEAGLSDKIVIKFNQPVYQDRKVTPIDKNYIITSLIDKNYITIYRENSTSNLASSSDIEISSDYTTITIIPRKPLISNRKYTVTVASGKFWNETGKTNAKATSTFSTIISDIPEFSPEFGAVDVPVDEAIEIRFEDEMRTVDGAALTATYIQNKVVTLCKNNEDGEVVKFTAKLSNNNKTITITPSSTYNKGKLEGGTTYVIIISGETMLDSKGNLNSRFTSSFVTEEAVVQGSEMVSPEHKATGVPIDTDVVIEFYSSLYKTTGDLVSAEYFKNNGISVTTGSSSLERKNDFEYSVSEDGKIITLTPKKPLDAKTKYNIKILKGSVKYFNGTDITATTYYFTTGDGIPVVNTFEVTEETVSSVAFNVKASADGVLYVTATAGSDSIEKTYELMANSEEALELTGLAPDTSYRITYYFEDINGKKSSEKSVNVHTAEEELNITGIYVTPDKGSALYKEYPGEVYDLSLYENTEHVTITVAASIENVTVEINGKEENRIEVEPGKHEIEVKVTSESGLSVTCTINLTVPEAPTEADPEEGVDEE